jgi:hypothetical protein
MFYYYAHTSHRGNLDALRRGVAFIKELSTKGIAVTLLVNDFRASIVAKELGVSDVLNMETISDIDLVLEYGDRLLIDSTEDLPLQFAKYCSEYKVYRVAVSCNDVAIYNETVIYPWISEVNQAIFINKVFEEVLPKVERTLFFFGDSDPNKTILANSKFFAKNNMELLLGHYFYLQYESEIGSLFSEIHEAEEYTELIRTSSKVVTCSLQCALEAKASGAKTIFLAINEVSKCQKELLGTCEIEIIDGFNQNFTINISDENIDTMKNVHNKTNYNLFLS